jgi:alkylated DNA repair protein (DNA oxidative demethylase)
MRSEPLSTDLFESVPDVRPSRQSMAEGAVLLRGLAMPVESDLIAALRDIAEQRRVAT